MTKMWNTDYPGHCCQRTGQKTVEKEKPPIILQYTYSILILHTKHEISYESTMRYSYWINMTFYLTRLFFAIAWVSCGGTSSRVLHTAPTIFQRFSSGFCRQRGADALSACSTTFPTLMGLKNLGYTCYLNSVIQALHHCEQFSEAVNIASYQHGTAGKELQSLFRYRKAAILFQS